MLREEAESFSKDDDDLGCAEGLQLKINLSDNNPVQKNYKSIPKPLYSEVKQYVEDLLNRGWVQKSCPAYSSPVVCVWKRDGSLRLCVDFRELNRRTVPDRITQPLCELLKRPVFKRLTQTERRSRKGNGTQAQSSYAIVWTQEYQGVLEKLVDCLTNPPILGYPDYRLSFVLHTDASNEGLGAVLYKRQSGKMRVIGYGSRTLTTAEKNYHLHSGKLEFLALKWAICEQFRDYLYYAPSFTVYTDNNPLTYVLSTAKLNSTGHRCVLEVANFNFEIKYRLGKVNKDADTLSRLPLDINQYIPTCTLGTSQDVISAALSGVMALQNGDAVWITAVSGGTEALNLYSDLLYSRSYHKIEPQVILAAQKQDPSM
ncbi:uncharacterized protein [Montipora capricornis]|uniref:uncharacterized protein n=1 Tax=Montipora capricornis TaxID=246305 RepID=UPI0035F13FC5